MKYLLFLFLAIIVCSPSFAQSPLEKSYHFIYLASWTFEKDDPTPAQEYVSLSVKGDSSIYQKYNTRKLDSIRSFREPTGTEKGTLFNHERYAIEFTGNNLTFYDKIGDRHLKYKEELNHKWKLFNESKTIQGYACKKATVSYGGREWTAWYAPELPFSLGPYKFRGLPGLIIKVTDATGDFDFELKLFKEKNFVKLTRYIPLSENNEYSLLDRLAYNKLRLKWSTLSINERMAMMNNGSGATLSFTSTSGEPLEMNTTRANKSKSEIGFIERDHD